MKKNNTEGKEDRNNRKNEKNKEVGEWFMFLHSHWVLPKFIYTIQCDLYFFMPVQ